VAESAEIPAAVADLKARQWPVAVREAVTDRADAVRDLHAPAAGAAREQPVERIARADKQLARVPHRLSI